MNGNQTSDPKRMILAVGLSTAVIIAWSLLFPPAKPPKHPKAPPSATASASTTPSAAGSTPSAPQGASDAAPTGDPFAGLVESTLTLTVADRHAVAVGNRDGQLQSWDLLDAQYRDAGTEPGQGFRFLRPAAADFTRGYFLPPEISVDVGPEGGAVRPVRGVYQLAQPSADKVVATLVSPDGLEIRRTYTLAATPYAVAAEISIANRSSAPQTIGLHGLLRGAQNNTEAAGKFGAQSDRIVEGLCARGDKMAREGATGIVKKRAEPESLPRFTDGIRYGGVDNKYFLSGLLAGEGDSGIAGCELFTGSEAAGVPADRVAKDTTYVSARLDLTGATLAPGQTLTRTYTLYGGPKKLESLNAQTPILRDAVDYGMWSPLCLPMLSTLQWFYGLIPNWGVAIVLLTLLVKLLTLPLTQKQYKSMAAMRAIQPELKALQEKFKDDRMRLQQEMMALYKVHGVNPLAGCLPVLMMMPVYISLYRTIGQAVELYHADLGLWIHDLSAADPYFILPIALGGLFIFQTRLNPPAGDPVQQKLMTWFMPIFFTAMMLFLPAGLVVYILCNTLLGIVQQAYMNKRVAAPTPATAPAGARGRT